MERHFCDFCEEEMNKEPAYRVNICMKRLGNPDSGVMGYNKNLEFDSIECMLGFFASRGFTNQFTGDKELFLDKERSGTYIANFMEIDIRQVKK